MTSSLPIVINMTNSHIARESRSRNAYLHKLYTHPASSGCSYIQRITFFLQTFRPTCRRPIVVDNNIIITTTTGVHGSRPTFQRAPEHTRTHTYILYILTWRNGVRCYAPPVICMLYNIIFL